MTTTSGVGASLGISDEVTYGTAVLPVTRWHEFVNETLKLTIERMESKGLRNQRVLRSTQWVPGRRFAKGDIMMELGNQGLGLLFKHMFGSVSTSGGAGVFTHTFTPGDLIGKSFTAQLGRPSSTGTVYPFTYYGCKVEQWELACKAGEIATLKLSVTGQNEWAGRTVTDAVTTGTNTSPVLTSATAVFSGADVGLPISDGGVKIPAATTILSVQSATSITMSANASSAGTGLTVNIGPALATPSYPSTLAPHTFVGGTLTIGGSQVDVRDVNLKGVNNIDSGRFFLRNSALPKEQLEHGYRDYTGIFTPDFDSVALYNRFVAGTEAALVLQFVGGVISGASSYTLTVTCNVRFDGDTPSVTGPDMLHEPTPYKCVAPSTDASAITWAYVTSDATP